MTFKAVVRECNHTDILKQDYRQAQRRGNIRLGAEFLFFRKLFTVYYVPYEEIRRCFRRVQLLPTSGGRRNNRLQVENIVVCTDKAEVAQLQVPGAQAAKVLMTDLKERIPNCDFSCPPVKKKQK